MLDSLILIFLIILLIALSFILILLKTYKKHTQIRKVFLVIIALALWWVALELMQIVLHNYFNMPSIYDYYFETFASIGKCFLPVFIFLLGLVFARTKIQFNRLHTLLFIIPSLTFFLMLTNDLHHLVYVEYSIYTYEAVLGPYAIIHQIYSYAMLGIGMVLLLYYSIKNAGFFSKQSILILTGTMMPVIVNILETYKIVELPVYSTPISFAIAVVFYALSIFKFDFLKVAPIALQRIVDRMSDSYIILNEDETITDFNATFLTTFKLKDYNVRNVNVFDLISSEKLNLISEKKLKKALSDVKKSSKTVSFDKEFPSMNKFFHIEINTITSKGAFLGTLILFKDTTQHMQDMQTIKDNQDMLMEKERLASLGQLIGGIAHNLKTPIMSIAGASEGLNDLIKEYDSSIGDPEVTNQDHHDIAKDMSVWVEKIKEYTEYMSDVITAVKGQAVVMSEQDTYTFTVDELVKRVNILMRHELKNALVNLNTSVQIDGNTELKGNVNSLVQVINNMISNSIQAYNGKADQNIEFTISKEKSNIILSIKDYAGGLPKEVSDKLFKEMITTKGKNGTGLGLFMSYSNIRAHFNGNITASSTPGVGTEFRIILPV